MKWKALAHRMYAKLTSTLSDDAVFANSEAVRIFMDATKTKGRCRAGVKTKWYHNTTSPRCKFKATDGDFCKRHAAIHIKKARTP